MGRMVDESVPWIVDSVSPFSDELEERSESCSPGSCSSASASGGSGRETLILYQTSYPLFRANISFVTAEK